ncbi:MAG: ketopantoate reductase family protein [Candidatus Hydrothermarchaeota archaeon]
MNILIMGAGALGSVFGGFLSRTNDVVLVGRDPHIEAINRKGLRISGIWGEHTFNVKAYTDTSGIESQDIVFITTKAYDTRKALEQILPLLSEESIVISMQNGIGNEEVIEALVGRRRTMGGMAIFGARIVSPGHVEVTVYASECLVGSLNGDAKKSEMVARLISEAGIPAKPSDDIIREKWMKAFYNIALNPLSAILKVPYGMLGENEGTLAIMRSMLEESFQVARAEGINLRFTAEEYFRYLIEKQLPPTAKHKSSMLQDIERGKRTEIDYLNGFIVKLGKKHGISTPVNETITNILKTMEDPKFQDVFKIKRR